MYEKAGKVYNSDVVRTDATYVQKDKSHRELCPIQANDQYDRSNERNAILASSSENTANMRRKIRHFNDLSSEHMKNHQTISHILHTKLHEDSLLREEKVQKRSERREDNFKKLRNAEMRRLDEIIAADSQGRQYDKQRTHDKNKNVNIKIESLRHF